MKRTISIILSAAMLICLAAAALPMGVFAWTAKHEPVKTPAGYNDHEYQLLVELFEYTDAEGVSNGYKLNPDYDPENPETWQDPNPETWVTNVAWAEVDGENRVVYIDFTDKGMVGLLDLNGFEYISLIDASGNHFSGIDVSDVKLNCERIDVSGSKIGGIDTSDIPGLVSLVVEDCGLTELDVSKNPDLAYLYCTDNELEFLDVSNNPSLWWFYCGGNKLTELDLTNNPALGPFVCDNNMLTSLDLSNNTALWSVDCHNNELTELILPAEAVGMFGGISSIDCSNNHLTELDLPNMEVLELLNCTGNEIAELDLSSCTTVTELYCADNRLTELDVTGLDALNILCFGGNSITAIDLSSNTSLFILDGDYMSEIALHSDGYEWEENLHLYPIDIALDTDGNGMVRAELAADVDEDSVFFPKPYINARAIISARANEGFTFVGWFDAEGNLVSEEAELTYTEAGLTIDLTAKFEENAVEPTEVPVEPTEEPVEPTEAPVEPTEVPVGPTPEPTTPPTPSTGAFSIAGIGIMTIIAGAGVVAARKRK